MPEPTPALDGVVKTIGDSGLVPADSEGVVMLSGGPDSTALLAGLVRLLGPGSLVAIHLNYGLRQDSDDDQEACERTCRDLGVELVVEVPGDRKGNLHDWARRERYSAAERLREARRLDWVAAGHTSTDLAETVLYRLATSPGTRALTAMPARRGSLVRPLLGLDRPSARAAAVESGLAFVDDPSNLDPSFARSRIRAEVMPVLEDLNPAAVENIVRTRREVAEESDLIASIAERLITDDDGRPAIPAPDLVEAHPAVARHAVRLLAEASTGVAAPASVGRTAEVRRLCGRPEGGTVELGGGIEVSIESGLVMARRTGDQVVTADPVMLEVPGEVGWGPWQIAAERLTGPVRPRGPEVATLDASGLPGQIQVRAWSEGDRMRQLGMTGSRPVADLLAERGVRRTERRTRPVLVADGEVVWVPGIAVAERHRIESATVEVVLLKASRSDSNRAP